MMTKRDAILRVSTDGLGVVIYWLADGTRWRMVPAAYTTSGRREWYHELLACPARGSYGGYVATTQGKDMPK